jgi:hypothetical protein
MKSLDPFDNKLPIVVDLDGTLIFNDISRESLGLFCLRFPWKIILLPFWAFRGVAYGKRRLAEEINIDPKTLRYNKLVTEFIQAHGDHRIFLATGADQKYANLVAEYLGVFEQVLASDGIVNNISVHKARRLDALLGKGGYIYLGNSSQDISVWKHAAYAIAVNASEDVIQELKNLHMPYEVLR